MLVLAIECLQRLVAPRLIEEQAYAYHSLLLI